MKDLLHSVVLSEFRTGVRVQHFVSSTISSGRVKRPWFPCLFKSIVHTSCITPVCLLPEFRIAHTIHQALTRTLCVSPQLQDGTVLYLVADCVTLNQNSNEVPRVDCGAIPSNPGGQSRKSSIAPDKFGWIANFMSHPSPFATSHGLS